MSYAILWFSCLATCILFVTLTISFSSKYDRAFWRWFWPLLFATVVLLIGTPITLLFWLFWIFNITPRWLFPYALTIEIGFIVASFLVLKNGLKKRDIEPTGRFWPRQRLVIAFFFSLFIFAGTYFFIDIDMRSQIRRLQAEANEKVVNLLPTSLPENLTAENLYTKAAEMLTGKPLYYTYSEQFDSEKELPDWFGYESDTADFDPNRPEVISFLDSNREVLDLLHRATAIVGCMLKFDEKNILFSPWPETYGDFARLFSLSAKTRIMEGDFKGAMNELAAVGRMEEQLLKCYMSPFLVSYINRIKTKTTEFVFAHISSPQDSINEIPLKMSVSIKGNHIKALEMAEAAYLQFFASFGLDIGNAVNKYAENFITPLGGESIPAQLLDRNKFVNQITTIFWRVFFAKADIEFITRKWSTMHKYAEMPYSKKRVHRKFSKELHEKEPMGLFSKLYLPIIPIMTNHEIKTENILEANRNMTNLALAATSYWLSFGKYPTELQDLVPKFIDKIPEDPFDGKLLKMAVLEDGLVLYSVGPDPMKDPLRFYLGNQIYEKYRIDPAKLERAERENRKKELEIEIKKESQRRKEIAPKPKRRKKKP